MAPRSLPPNPGLEGRAEDNYSRFGTKRPAGQDKLLEMKQRSRQQVIKSDHKVEKQL
jgi:hypothetical protein